MVVQATIDRHLRMRREVSVEPALHRIVHPLSVSELLSPFQEFPAISSALLKLASHWPSRPGVPRGIVDMIFCLCASAFFHVFQGLNGHGEVFVQ